MEDNSISNRKTALYDNWGRFFFRQNDRYIVAVGVDAPELQFLQSFL
jgi:hypothetical protein